MCVNGWAMSANFFVDRITAVGTILLYGTSIGSSAVDTPQHRESSTLFLNF